MSQHQDFGQKIGGARKDLRGNFLASDIDSLTHIERNKLCRKDMVWPTPDYAALLEQGVPRVAIAIIKMVRDSFPACPPQLFEMTDEQFASLCVKYVEVINAAKRISTLKSVEEIKTFACTDQGVASTIGTITRDEFQRYRAISKPSAQVSSLRGSSSDIMSALNYAQQGALDHTMDKVLRKNPEWPLGNSRAEATIRRQRLSIARDISSNGYSVASYGTIIKLDNASYYRKTVGPDIIGKVFASEEEGMTALIAAVEGVFADKRAVTTAKREAILGKPVSDEPTYRVGTEVRDRSAVGTDYLNDFGMRGGEFGNWVNDRERQEVLDRGYDAFADLAKILKMAPGQLSLGGKLAIAFGARGNGGRDAAAAHYEPARRVINLTKPHGEGCLAHEFLHALDHHLGDIAHSIGLSVEANEYGTRFLSARDISERSMDKVSPENRDVASKLLQLSKKLTPIWEVPVVETREQLTAEYEAKWEKTCLGVPAVIQTRLNDLGTTLRYLELGEAKKAEVLAVAEAQIMGIFKPENVANRHGAITRAIAEIRKSMGRKGSLTRLTDLLENDVSGLHYLSLTLKELRDVSKPLKQRTRKSDYFRACQKIDRDLGKTKPYYQTRIEMFARAFEACVEDTLVSQKESNPFLVAGTRNEAFPQGTERETIRNEVFPLIIELASVIPDMGKPKEKTHAELSFATAPTETPLSPEETPSIRASAEDQSPAVHRRPVIQTDLFADLLQPSKSTSMEVSL